MNCWAGAVSEIRQDEWESGRQREPGSAFDSAELWGSMHSSAGIWHGAGAEDHSEVAQVTNRWESPHAEDWEKKRYRPGGRRSPSPTSLHPTDQFQPVQKAIRPREMEGRDRFTGSHSSFSYLLAPRCHPSSVPLPGTLRRGANPGTALAAEAWRSPSARALWDREVFSGSWRSCGCRETRSIQPRLHQSPAHRGPCPLYALQASLRLVSAPTLP